MYCAVTTWALRSLATQPKFRSLYKPRGRWGRRCWRLINRPRRRRLLGLGPWLGRLLDRRVLRVGCDHIHWPVRTNFNQSRRAEPTPTRTKPHLGFLQARNAPICNEPQRRINVLGDGPKPPHICRDVPLLVNAANHLSVLHDQIILTISISWGLKPGAAQEESHGPFLGELLAFKNKAAPGPFKPELLRAVVTPDPKGAAGLRVSGSGNIKTTGGPGCSWRAHQKNKAAPDSRTRSCFAR
jgi:hypothetical protein